MSWEQFRQNVQRKLCDASKVSSIEYVAEVYATEYDLCMKRGGTIPDKIPIVKGNVDGMKAAFIQALKTGLTYTSTYDLTGAMGAGVKIYWTGATLFTPTPPLITPQQVAAGGVTNIVANTNNVTSPCERTNTNAPAIQTELPSQPSQQDSANQPPQDNSKKILIVGDSITVDAGYTWSSLYKKLQKDKQVEILAKTGEQLTTWMQPQLELKLKSNKYDKVYIYGGVNDCYSGKKTSQILSTLQNMVDSIITNGGKAVVITGYDAEKDMGDNSTKPTNYVKTKAEMEQLLTEYRIFQKSINNIKNATIVPKISIGVLLDGFHPTGGQPKKLYEHISKY